MYKLLSKYPKIQNALKSEMVLKFLSNNLTSHRKFHAVKFRFIWAWDPSPNYLIMLSINTWKSPQSRTLLVPSFCLFSSGQGFIYPRLPLNFLCNWGWSWTTDPPAFTTDCWNNRPAPALWFMWCWAIKPRASHLLSKHSTNGATAPVLLPSFCREIVTLRWFKQINR